MKIIKYFGPPGCGKTTKLLSLVEEHLEAGIKPQRIGFISFTKRAANEARERAITRFDLKEEALPYFRTIHSLVFKQLGLKRESVIQWKHYNELGRMLGLYFQGRSMDLDGVQYGMGLADRIMFLENLARVKRIPLKQVWESANEDINYWELERYARALYDYKKRKGLLDFQDMLEQFVAANDHCVPELNLLIVDEAQDLSISQFDVVKKLMTKAKQIYLSGDDEQCIFSWSGADSDLFLNLEGEIKILHQSYRVPATVHKAALSISASIRNKQEKTWLPKVGSPGTVSWHATAEEVDMSKGTWLVLARNGYMLAPLEDLCIRSGLSFTSVGKSPLDSPALKAVVLWERLRKGVALSTQEMTSVDKYRTRVGHANGALPIWHEALDKISPEEREFFIAARRRGETLTKKPRINISTIHASKGGQAENILLMTDVSAKTFETMQRNPEEEHKVWYVAVTRTMENLHLVQPQTVNYFPIQ